LNYTELLASIQTYTENAETDFVAEIPTFVQQTEDRVFHTVQLPDFKKNATATATASSEYLATPTDFVAPYSLAVTNGTDGYGFLLSKDLNFLRQAYPSAATEGEPRFYALWDDDTFMLAPTPDSAYTMQLDYYYKPESIVTATNTWLGDNFPSVLLYGCLVEAYIFMKGEEDMLNTYKTQYMEALDRLKVLGEGKDRKDTYRSGQIRQEVT
jgi:hypothetical protein